MYQEKRRINLQQNVMTKEHEIGDELRSLFDSQNITAFEIRTKINE